MDEKIISRSKELFNSDLVENDINISNQVKWAKAVVSLGDKWLLAKPIEKPIQGGFRQIH